MYALILGIAQNDTRIKAVYMNGSRTNENVPKDMFQDYDIVYVVEDTKSFIEDKDWIHLFGDILYMQVEKPTKEQYFAVCNEFWWCSNNIAKGLWRGEIPYVIQWEYDR